jgi:hypothetical protein
MGVIHDQATATIANGQTTSAAVYVGDKLPATLRMPAAFTGASVSFQGSPDGVTYQALNVGGSAYTEVVAASKDVVLDSSVFAGSPYIKIVSASAEGAARTLIVITRRVGR